MGVALMTKIKASELSCVCSCVCSCVVPVATKVGWKAHMVAIGNHILIPLVECNHILVVRAS